MVRPLLANRKRSACYGGGRTVTSVPDIGEQAGIIERNALTGKLCQKIQRRLPLEMTARFEEAGGLEMSAQKNRCDPPPDTQRLSFPRPSRGHSVVDTIGRSTASVAPFRADLRTSALGEVGDR